MKRLAPLIVCISVALLYPSLTRADTQPRLKRTQELFGWSGSTIPDLTSAGTVTGTDAAFTNLVSCTVAANATGNLYCSSAAGSGTVTSISQGTNMSFSVDPITTTGTINLTASPSVTNLTASGTVTGAVISATAALQVRSDYITDITGSGLTITGGALTATNSGDITDVNEGLAIDVTNSTGPAPTVAFDPTELLGSRTWGDASTDTIVWTWDRATGTDPTLTFGSNTVTGPIVAASSAFQIAGDNITDFTGVDLSVVAGAVTVDTLPNLTGILDVDSGGTGVATLASNGVVYGNGTGVVLVTAQGGANTVLTANAGAPSFSTNPTVTSLTATGTVTGLVVSGTSALQVGSDYVQDITGNDLTISGGGLSVANSARDRTIGTFCGGAMSTTMNCEEARAYNPNTCTLQKFEVAATTAPTGQSLVIDPLECPTPGACYSILPIASRPTITAGNLSAEVVTTGITVTAGDYLGLNVIQVGSGTAGSNVSMTTVCRY